MILEKILIDCTYYCNILSKMSLVILYGKIYTLKECGSYLYACTRSVGENMGESAYSFIISRIFKPLDEDKYTVK